MENKSQLKQFNDELQMVLIKYTATLVDSDGMIVVHMPSKDDRNIISKSWQEDITKLENSSDIFS